jgi:hypothetical protein
VTWNLFSLVLAAATGWAVLAIGFLPVAVLRQEGREAVKAAGAWAIVAATAPATVYHWYLIFALICLVAWTKLERPVGKIVLAVAASLGLSLGIVFPLEAVPDAIAVENPWALASLYLGGAAAGLAYALAVIARAPDSTRRPAGFARALVLATILWIALLALTPHWLGHVARPLVFSGSFHLTVVTVNVWMPLVPTVALLALAWFALRAVRRGALEKARLFAGAASALAFGTSLFAQFVLR